MALDERARHTLYTWMQETADDERADALMASLPPTAWPDLATKHDLEIVQNKLATVFYKEIAGLHKAATAQTKVYIAWTTAVMAILAGVTTVAVR